MFPSKVFQVAMIELQTFGNLIVKAIKSRDIEYIEYKIEYKTYK